LSDEQNRVETEVKPQIEWHEFKGGRHLMMKGDMLLGIIEPSEGLPCEAYHFQPVAGLFTTIEAAKAEAEKSHARFLANHVEDGKPPENFYLEILKQVVVALEAKFKP
jgi:hypothetical protein